MRKNWLRDETYIDEFRDDLTLLYPGWPRYLIHEASRLASNIMLAFEKRGEEAGETQKTKHERGMPIKLGMIPGKIHHCATLLVLERFHYCELALVLVVFGTGVNATVFIRKGEWVPELYSVAPLTCGGPYMIGTGVFQWPKPHLITVRNLQRVLEERVPWHRHR